MSANVGSRSARFRAALALALAGAALLCFALPASIWLGNQAEFHTAWPALLWPLLPPGIGLALACAAVVALLPARDHPAAIVLLATLVLLAWVQSYVLVWEYGLFDGRAIDWARYPWRGWVDAAVWIGALVAAHRYRDRLVRVLPRVAIVACVLQALFVAAALAHPPRNPKAQAGAPGDQLATLAAFSPRGNVLHIIADGLQTDVVQDLLAEDGGALAKNLDGFVFFEDHLGAFPYTHFAVPALIGGHTYDNAQPQGRFLDGVLGHGSILGAARDAGYDVELGVPAGGIEVVYAHAVDARRTVLPDALPEDSGGAHPETLLLADLALFRAVPHFAKRLVYNDDAWRLQPLFGGKVRPGHAFLAHEQLLRDLAAKMTATRPRPTYKVVHVMLSHSPMVVDRDCAHTGRVLEMVRENVDNQARCGMRAVMAVLARMRELGIYDDATIVVGGDHGAFVPPAAFDPGTPGLAEAQRRGYNPQLFGMARPALLVKPPRARGPVRRSQAPSAMTDTAATIADAAGIPGTFPGTSALRLDPAAPRTRRFHYYPYDKSNWTSDYLPPIAEFIVEGRSDDISAWRVGRNFRPPAGSP